MQAVAIAVYASGSPAILITWQILSQMTRQSIYPLQIIILVCLKLTQQDDIDSFKMSSSRISSPLDTIVFARSGANDSASPTAQVHNIHISTSQTTSDADSTNGRNKAHNDNWQEPKTSV
ncbi:hypothetical protein PHLCEN_2v9483 [Hermanssonia centrifuga]|uniref:Uncharacterized protein n=1 Tax=Hermanssonia centrifuga TaxID=98765 RepID=A0A2R6NRF6_9APHY|nr:hypothetical protein PHLCEN_2v9483 [Hermanssonia centrifuga]